MLGKRASGHTASTVHISVGIALLAIELSVCNFAVPQLEKSARADCTICLRVPAIPGLYYTQNDTDADADKLVDAMGARSASLLCVGVAHRAAFASSVRRGRWHANVFIA